MSGAVGVIIEATLDASRRGVRRMDAMVLEWRLDRRCASRIPEVFHYDIDVVVCRQGYSSSLAVASLRAIGLHRAADLVGGAEAWIATACRCTTEL